MSVKREVITGVLLIIVMAPALVQAVAPAQENDVLPLVDLDIWVADSCPNLNNTGHFRI
jgi:hypothetical protein